MTDLDTISTLHEILNCGTVYKQTRIKDNKQSWSFQVSKQEDIYKVLVQFEPFLMGRRSDKAREMLEYITPRLIKKGKIRLTGMT